MAVAFHARLFNSGGEEQAQLGALGVALVSLAVPWSHWLLALPDALFDAGWAAIPAQLHRRGADGLPAGRNAESAIGTPLARTPLNVRFPVALAACWFVWLLPWRTRHGYEVRAFRSKPAAIYAGISRFRITMIAMLISGALAGLMATNAATDEQQRPLQHKVRGAGIAVALMSAINNMAAGMSDEAAMSTRKHWRPSVLRN